MGERKRIISKIRRRNEKTIMKRKRMLLPHTLYVKGLSPYGPDTSGSPNQPILLISREDVIKFI
jgi:hypothetical protein